MNWLFSSAIQITIDVSKPSAFLDLAMAIWRAQASSKASDRRLLQSSFVDAQPAQRRKQPLPSVNVSARGLSDPIRAAICRDDDLVDGMRVLFFLRPRP
ncbi:hypothetical protein T06_1873 [Trichinella sp. T6]|nr:hypothetical protein T06_1873 [Trichinella sp. T6]